VKISDLPSRNYLYIFRYITINVWNSIFDNTDGIPYITIQMGNISISLGIPNLPPFAKEDRGGDNPVYFKGSG
jgi:hypothetical protein